LGDITEGKSKNHGEEAHGDGGQKKFPEEVKTAGEFRHVPIPVIEKY
jgi:hypothetical protein